MYPFLILFGATFISVFAMGFQSRNNIGGHYISAFVTSVIIGFMTLYLYKVLPVVTDPLQVAGYILGGPCGITASMWFHSRFFPKKKVA